jgi:DNA uptake protein ComE-like DNA-binding protein
MLPRRFQLLVLAGFFTICAAAHPFSKDHSAGADKVDINRASLAELEHLPGVTPVWAKRIVHFRPYKTKLDLLNQGIVPAAVYSEIRDVIVAHRTTH